MHRLPRVQRPDSNARGPDVELICSRAGRENISSSIALVLEATEGKSIQMDSNGMYGETISSSQL